MLKQIDERIDYCEEQKRRLVDFLERVDSGTVDYDGYKFYLEHYLQNKSPIGYLIMLDDHIKECKRLRRTELQKTKRQNSRYILGLYVLKIFMVLFVVFFLASLSGNQLIAPHAIKVDNLMLDIPHSSEYSIDLPDCMANGPQVQMVIEQVAEQRKSDESIEDMICMINETLMQRNITMNDESMKIINEILLELD